MTSVTVRRRRIAAGVAAALVALTVVVVLALALPGSSAKPPDTGAARLVPSTALAYLNVSLDRRRPGVAAVLRLASSKLPAYGVVLSTVQGRLAAAFGSAGDFGSEARPWIGDEAAAAVLPQPRSPRRAAALILLTVRRPAAARSFLAGVSNAVSTSYRGISVQRLAGGGAVAMIGRYLVLGSPGDVQAAIDAARDPAASLASLAAYRRVNDGAPPGRVADLYLAGAGVPRVLGGRSGLLGAIRVLGVAPGVLAASASLSAAPGGLRVRLHTVFAPGTEPPEVRPLTPSLLSSVPSGAAFALDIGDLTSSAPRLLNAMGQLGVGGAVGPLLSRLGGALHAEGVDVRPLLQLFSGESVVALTSAPRPGLLVITRTDDPGQAKAQLANLAPALASLFPAASSGPGVAPLFTSHQVNGVLIHQLKLGPGLQGDYAVFKDLVGISTGVDALSALGRRGPALPATSSYRAVLGGFSGRVTSLVFLDLKVLFRLGEQAGLLGGAVLRTLAPDLDRIQAVALRSRSGKADSTSELYFKIS